MHEHDTPKLAAAIFISYAEFPSDKALESLQMFHDLGNIYS
jgi:hypothetical protein